MMSTTSTGDHPERIVVGIDGSPSSLAALAWAARQAELTAAPLAVVVTWAFPNSYGYPVGWPEDFDPAADAKSILDDSVKAVLGAHPSIPVTTEVVAGHPSVVLVEESKSAALVVVGCRGHGELRECCSAR